MPHELPIVSQPEPTRRLPSWLRREVPKGNLAHFTAGLVQELGLETVCDHAQCPNRMECFSKKTATFMILGDLCTRSCRFCAVGRGKPRAIDPDEPKRIAIAVKRLGLKHVVITSVTRDDLPDGGAEHFCQCIRAVRESKGRESKGRESKGRESKERESKEREPTGTSIEVLTPDFLYNSSALERVAQAAPDVFGHNTETVPRLYQAVRGPKSDYRWTLELLRQVKDLNPQIKTKSGMMLGIGETRSEVLDVLADLLDHGCAFLTLGQYLQPSRDLCLPVVRYLPPDEFEELGQIALQMGFQRVASGPFVRSSYHAREMLSRPATK